MAYYKHVENGYILAIGEGGGRTEITETEYNEIMTAIQSKPPWEGTTDYHLKEDLTWEAYTREPVDSSNDELSAEDALSIITGGET